MSIYNVSVIPQNLRREETVIQIAQSLKYLSDVSNNIFEKINNRLDKYTKQLNVIEEKIDKVNGKISSLSVAKKAIQVFSSSKYPASEINKPYESIFYSNDSLEITRFPIKYKEQQSKEEPLDKLQFFHITASNGVKVKSEGLGDIPVEVNSINDFLLYNSGKNPYRKYVISDTLQLLQMAKKENVFEGKEIGAAPISITDSTVMMKASGETYFYSPDLGDVPTIDVPIDLPDLPGIADDLRYTDETGPGIAPSVTTTPNVPNLPQFEVEDLKIEPKIEEKEKIEVVKEIPPELPKIIQPPPPPMIEEIKAEVIKMEIKPVQSEPQGAAIEITDSHASLMDAIRKAGGLRNAKLRSTEPKEPVTKQSGGDLMADFHAKLSLRRKGISGAKKPNEWDVNSAMSKISEMLRPPVPTEPSEPATTEDEDDEWE